MEIANMHYNCICVVLGVIHRVSPHSSKCTMDFVLVGLHLDLLFSKLPKNAL